MLCMQSCRHGNFCTRGMAKRKCADGHAEGKLFVHALALTQIQWSKPFA